jgi:hypothetical protein
LWNKLQLSSALGRALHSSQRRFDAEALVRVMVFNRLCESDSKLRVLRWLETVIIRGLPAQTITHQHLFRAVT